jgi:DNA-binding response OmpR family regulator
MEVMSAKRLLLVEDDARLASLVREYLQQHDFHVEIEPRGDRAVQRILQERPQVVVLDLMLPGMNGIDVCRTVRSRFPGPILMLTASDDDVDQIVSLEVGADDYVVKPVEPRVLLARIRALLRRVIPLGSVAEAEEGAPLTFGRLKIEPSARRVTLGEEPLELSAGEFDLLLFLASQAGQLVNRKTLLASLRRIDYDGTDRSIDIGISRLRRKLGDTTEPPARIKTVRGKGYLFVADAWD